MPASLVKIIASIDVGHSPASLLKMSLFHRCFFTHFVSKSKLLGLFKWNIDWEWVNICLEIPFTKNGVGLETSQLFCIANHLSSFCLIRSLTKKCFWIESGKFVNVPKSFQALNFRFSFPLWSVTSVSSSPEHSFSFTVAQNFILNRSLVLKLFVFFLDILNIYSQRKYV